MKYKLGMIGGTYAALILASTALAVEPLTPNPATENEDLQRRGDGKSQRESLGRTEKGSELMGKAVTNYQDEKLGKVEDIMVDLAAGRVVAVVISSGGFLGMGDVLSIVPPTSLKYNSTGDSLQLDASKETLSAAPHFKAGEWPDLAKDGYAGRVYSAYRVEPYFDTSAPRKADNTARNERDRDGNSLTPLDQGSSENDLEITTKIRKDVVAHEGMSINGQNVKIITSNGKVTLRGPVNTAEEKRLVGEYAIKATRKESVENHLEVK